MNRWTKTFGEIGRCVRAWLVAKRLRPPEGVHDLGPSFWCIFTLYVLSVGLLGQDPWFGDETFTYRQGGMVFLIGVLTVSGVAFEWRNLGVPRGPNLLLHGLLILPFTLFLGRVVGRPTHPGPGGLIQQGVQLVGDGLKQLGFDQFAPTLVVEAFAQPILGFALLGICLALALRKPAIRYGVLALTLVVPLASTIGSPPVPSGYFWGGTLLMAAGTWLQFMDYPRYERDLFTLTKLKGVLDRVERQTALELVASARARGFIDGKTFAQIVIDNYEHKEALVAAGEGREVAKYFCRTLVDRFGLFDVIRVDSNDIRLTLAAPKSENEGELTGFVTVARSVVVAVIALIWVISPVDLVPDSLPIIGVLDDVLVGWLGISQFVNSRKQNNAKD
jgi:hypothetical protein